ncbi:hypothetical protein LNTAR_09509 [Lentisphaera araneosa HTCC2155]|uniref:DUF4878 domain-containing protein n=1 Tax=Lentisphaera araneosa HTCC2155 TaxID=313628 RepID=A6DIE3_9BACT|nr:hypothetical protein [Lentisphaera araneosa]EDM28797.1 hypothetical protein LNTAR_09509 [Lentisphaera araneosa HTCC2155]
MKKILLSAMFILTTFVYAEVPKSLEGNWSLNKEASIKELESLDENEKTLAMMRLNVMSDIKYVVDDNSIKMSKKGKVINESTITKVVQDKKNVIIEISFSNKGKKGKQSLTFIPKDKGNYFIDSGKFGNMNQFVWSKN